MKRRFIHLQLTFVFACMLLFALTICSYAAEGFEGYAVYRDGAFLGTTWHGGLMDGAHPKKEKPVTHAAQSKSTVQSGSWGVRLLMAILLRASTIPNQACLLLPKET